ncbi:hypothetical protein HUN03_00295 [Mycoplasmopsis anatis]|uniref:DUF3923 family protein n=2 Tax=Mycoplasmopsis anatis TaxID=171279 RepID=F9QDP4_9BACT|nr:hypothetical protein [Mycoplasmopsis anatis]AWX69928.1 hypothetical protein DP067_00885 [Mycoplasmopsis anatis]EGS29071.1 hypothetical protein GIG_02588 [Mycoplasmopsis anatis 1340]MBW0594688.1 hypothetical protein [Mycoplasmopsis anatis]MBW0595505.1 hypothetical protein [Mycoplasmopsis anatis]MBW0595881.1 hypothetical protein [Mycoplasmopsis anatis]
MAKILNSFNKLHIGQKIYTILWFLFVVLLFVTVIVTGVYKPSSEELRANVIASIALITIVELFVSVILTVYINGFVLRKRGKK